jgi:formylglycine-generating enzyme required for sulfatase activity/uncharacterized protein (DUF433 family)
MASREIVSDPNVMKREPILAGTRITVRSILERLAAGESDAQIIEVYPSLGTDDIGAAQRYAAENLGEGAADSRAGPPPSDSSDPPFIHGWSTEQVQALQKAAAHARGMRVRFQDPSRRISAVREVNRRSVLVRKGGWFSDDEYEEVFDRQEVSVTLDPPTMVIIPGGSFLMGSPDAEAPYAETNETPQHRVTIQPFAISETAVTFEQYDAFAEVTGRDKRHDRPKDEGWGRGKRPVINVYWGDAYWYCQWLTEQTGQTYRLPTEAEWEYACRAGTTTLFSFGNSINTDQANYNGSEKAPKGNDKGTYLGKTQPVGSYPVNPWGLYDMHGNVREWTADGYHENYVGAPTDGSAWPGGDLVTRGGSWADIDLKLWSARRRRNYNSYEKDVGFRVVRELTP